MYRIRTVILALPLLASAIRGQAPNRTAATPVDFNREIRPILSDNCFTCHGPDDQKRQAGLRLDTKEGAFSRKGVIVAGDAEHSRLLRRVTAPQDASRMPPPSAGARLSEKQAELLKRWVEQGAKWEDHWSYVPPRRPEPPQLSDARWAKNAVDRFVLAKLERESRKPSPEADRATLLRRVTLDLTGLPPTPAEVASFLADRSPDAYEKRVDQLLASPRYGERMAVQWMDLARYADTHGYHIDSHRDMWPWRDWVIRSFNQNLPFDQFTVQQLAGDLLEKPTRDQLVATGFNRNHMINFEGGAIPEEYQTEYVIDRVDTTSTVWMGMTMGCARCHDHKYDPIKQKDFYRFFAFFNTIPEKGLDGRAGNAEPMITLPTDEQESRREALLKELEKRDNQLPGLELAAYLAAWSEQKLPKLPLPPRDGLEVHYEFDGHAADTSGRYQHGVVRKGSIGLRDGAVGMAATFDGETHVELGRSEALNRGPFTVSTWLRTSRNPEHGSLQKLSDAKQRRGFELLSDDSIAVGDLKKGSHLVVRLTSEWPVNGIELRSRNRFTQDEWHHVAVTYDGSSKAGGLVLWVDGKRQECEVLRDALQGPIANDRPLEIGNTQFGPAFKGAIDDLRIYSRVLTDQDRDRLFREEPIRATLLMPRELRSREQRLRVADYYFTYDAPAAFQSAYAEAKDMRKQLAALDKQIATAMVMKEMEKPRASHVLGRGDYRNPGEAVTPGVPAVLPPLPAGAPANRLTLARWLVNPNHPLTARVAVNRYWQMYFGTGLVKTAEDFGSQGEPPSHPELLDWLATEFVSSGWDVKAMQRLIVTSATYRQSSKVTPELLEKDPENRLLARGPRFRLPAEFLRDNALSISGLLREKVGGPSVFPYQPKGLWEELAFGDVYSAQTYTQDEGDALYRRSMYTFWKRTSPPPSLSTFDAPDREKCTARRTVTNTPLQSLVLLNDPTYVEAARRLAERLIREAGPDKGKRIALAYQLATARAPKPAEVRVLDRLVRQQLVEFQHHPEAAQKLLQVGDSPASTAAAPAELAAWTTLASVILNLDETITKQ